MGTCHAGCKGNENHEYGDGLVGGVDAVIRIGEVFEPDGQGDEVTQPEEHPTEEQIAEKAVFPDEAEVLPGVAHVLGAQR